MRSDIDTTLHPYQEEGVEWILRTPKGLLADEAGLGKTPQALVAVDRILRGEASGPSARALWITDASLLAQTRTEAARFAPTLSVLTGNDPGVRGPKAIATPPPEVDLMVLSYETVLRRREWLRSAAFAMLVLDEVSNVKGRGKQFDAVREIAERTPRVLSMTATPIENDPTELWSILSATDVAGLWSAGDFDRRFVTFRTGYVDRWGNAQRVPDGWQETSLWPLRSYLSSVVLRRTHEQVGSKRPQRIPGGVIDVDLTPAQEAAYERAQCATGRDAVRKMELASLFGGRRPPLVDALLKELRRREEQAIVYCETLDMLDLVEARLRENGLETCRIEGKVSEADRKAALERHRSGDVQILLASRVLEYGLNLQHCRLLISLNTSWNPARERQREGRICRLGSPHATYEHLVLRPKTPLAAIKAGRLEKKLRCAELVGL